MKNRDVCKEFIRREAASGSNLTSSGSKLLSYATCIAQWAVIDAQGVLLVNNTKYSVTTSKHQSYLRWHIPSYTKLIELVNVPKGTVNLIDYYYGQK